MIARVMWLACLLSACGLQSYELFPAAGADAGTDAGRPLDCFGQDCSGCPVPACTPPGCCHAACAPAGSCTISLREGTSSPFECPTAAQCGLSASLTTCAGAERECIVHSNAATEITCLRGSCRISCERSCRVHCPSGNCQLTCNGPGPCELVGCTPISCPTPSTVACGSCASR